MSISDYGWKLNNRTYGLRLLAALDQAAKPLRHLTRIVNETPGDGMVHVSISLDDAIDYLKRHAAELLGESEGGNA